MRLEGLEITWLGHSTVRFRTPEGIVSYVDPWLEDNPFCPAAEQQPERVDAVYLTHGHFDHMTDAERIARAGGATVYAIHEIAVYLEGRGLDRVVGLNKGGTVSGPGGVRATMVDAVHSGGMSGPDGIVPGGTPAGWVMEFPAAPTIYHAGDTMVFGDMALIAELWEPQIAMLPIGGHFVMDPRQAAKAARLLGVDTVVPIHWGTFPVLAGTPEELAGHLEGSGIEVEALEIGVPYR
jgi:L-ascorbate metabolism protein UlaG (beta-lactamase superfamily)